MLSTVFLAVLIPSFALIALLTRRTAREKVIEERLMMIAKPSHDAEILAAAATEELLREPTREGYLAQVDSFIFRFPWGLKLGLAIRQADRDITPAKLLMQSVGFAAVGGVGIHFFTRNLIAGFAAPLIGCAGPLLLLNLQRSKRLGRFDAALPESIDLLSRALKAGHSVSSAIEVVAEQGIEPVAGEFAEVFRAQNFGLPFRDALLQLGGRIPSKDLQILITAMMVQKETGGNLTEILDRTTYVLRERQRIQGEVRTKTAQGRLTGWILSLMPIALGVLINLINPGYTTPLFHDPLGLDLTYGGVAMISVGSFLISRIVKIEV